ncbi:MFS transporter [Stutzerimonas nosocomialis]|uniref:MFS transporter n=1 Tax=Stutzerimonas nosocomialis TaxID=1056496 RepID=UPI001107AD17|nr:MFS transporter [Stutzerimonas nosocomialis]TLX53069.1 MFS transporter [Stutzerimonas nosocomialis]
MLIAQNEYLLAWALYGVGALGLLLVWFRMTRPLWRWLREPLRLVVAVLLFTPTIVDPARELFAPAIAITALDVLFKIGNNAWRAVADLALYGLIAFGLYLALVALRWPLERWLRQRRGDVDDEQGDPRTLRERMEDDEWDEGRRRPGGRSVRAEPRL